MIGSNPPELPPLSYSTIHKSGRVGHTDHREVVIIEAIMPSFTGAITEAWDPRDPLLRYRHRQI